MHCRLSYTPCPYNPRVQSHASTSVRTLQIPNSNWQPYGCFTHHRKILHAQIEMGSAALAAAAAAAALSPFLTGRMFVRPNILRTLRRTMIRFLIELLVRRIWFGQSKLYFILNWLVMRCKLWPGLAADAQQTA